MKFISDVGQVLFLAAGIIFMCVGYLVFTAIKTLRGKGNR